MPILHHTIEGLGFENFRAFSNKTYFNLAPITIFTGTNNSGKSTVSKGLNLMKNYLLKRQGIMQDNWSTTNPDIMDVSELLEVLGDFNKLINHNSQSDILSFYLPIISFRGVSQNLQLKIDFKLQIGSLKQGKIIGLTLLQVENEEVVFSCKEIGELKYNIKINYYFFLQEYKKGFGLKELGDIYEETDKVYFDFLEEIIFTDTEDLLVYYDNLNDDWVTGADFFGISKEDYNNYEKDFLGKFEYNITYHDEADQEELTGIEPISKSMIEHWSETKRKTKSIENIFESIAYPSFCNGKNSTFFKFGHANFFFGDNSNLIELHQNDSDFMLKEFAFHNYENNIIIDKYETGNIFFKPPPRKIKEADNDLSMSEFFFKYFISNNIRYSFYETLYKSSINSATYFIGGFKSPIQRIITKSENPELYEMLTKILEAKGSSCNDFIDRCLKLFDLGTKLELERSSEIVGIYVHIIDKGKKKPLADMGLGVSQILPLILKIATMSLNWDGGDLSSLFVEEPEANLHPAMQSKLADMFVLAKEIFFNITFIIETHSEYLIRKFQYLTASNKSQLTPKDTVLYYFYHPDKVPFGESQVKMINILEDGSLSDDFGSGFFDEADKISLSLFGLQNSQKN